MTKSQQHDGSDQRTTTRDQNFTSTHWLLRVVCLGRDDDLFTSVTATLQSGGEWDENLMAY